MCQHALAAERDIVVVFFVCLSVCLSVHCWCVSEHCTYRLIAQLSGSDTVPFFALGVTKLQGTPNWGGGLIHGGIGKISHLSTKAPSVSENVRDDPIVTMDN